MALDQGTIWALLGGAGGLLTCMYYMQSIVKNFKHDKEAFKAAILQEAKEAIAKEKAEILAERKVIHAELQNQIKSLENDLDNHKDNVQKDLSHIRETYNGEIRTLGDKIEDLRVELRNQHGQLVGLLSEMIKNRD